MGRLPSCLDSLKATVHERFEGAINKASGGKDDPLGFVLKLAAGRIKECPFDERIS